MKTYTLEEVRELLADKNAAPIVARWRDERLDDDGDNVAIVTRGGRTVARVGFVWDVLRTAVASGAASADQWAIELACSARGIHGIVLV